VYKIKIGGGIVGRMSAVAIGCEAKDAMVLEMQKSANFLVKNQN
jgi:hypothetical protein